MSSTIVMKTWLYKRRISTLLGRKGQPSWRAREVLTMELVKTISQQVESHLTVDATYKAWRIKTLQASKSSQRVGRTSFSRALEPFGVALWPLQYRSKARVKFKVSRPCSSKLRQIKSNLLDPKVALELLNNDSSTIWRDKIRTKMGQLCLQILGRSIRDRLVSTSAATDNLCSRHYSLRCNLSIITGTSAWQSRTIWSKFRNFKSSWARKRHQSQVLASKSRRRTAQISTYNPWRYRQTVRRQNLLSSHRSLST